jgi:hypothetical protein
MGREFAPLAARCGQRGGAQKISPREETVILQLRQHLQRHLHPSRGEVAHHRSYSVGKTLFVIPQGALRTRRKSLDCLAS